MIATTTESVNLVERWSGDIRSSFPTHVIDERGVAWAVYGSSFTGEAIELRTVSADDTTQRTFTFPYTPPPERSD